MRKPAVKEDELTALKLRKSLAYDPQTGVFTRLAGGARAVIGSTPGCPNFVGYIQIGVNGNVYYAHRLAWLYVYGKWPIGDLDHINQCKWDNRIANLRQATRSQNLKNSRRIRSLRGRKNRGRLVAGMMWELDGA